MCVYACACVCVCVCVCFCVCLCVCRGLQMYKSGVFVFKSCPESINKIITIKTFNNITLIDVGYKNVVLLKINTFHKIATFRIICFSGF